MVPVPATRWVWAKRKGHDRNEPSPSHAPYLSSADVMTKNSHLYGSPLKNGGDYFRLEPIGFRVEALDILVFFQTHVDEIPFLGRQGFHILHRFFQGTLLVGGQFHFSVAQDDFAGFHGTRPGAGVKT